MKKFIPAVAFLVSAMMTVTYTALEKESMKSENPLLAANVEALSAAEVVNPDILDLGNGAVIYNNRTNPLNDKGKAMNYCISETGSSCLINPDRLANGKVNWMRIIRELLENMNMRNLLGSIEKLLQKF